MPTERVDEASRTLQGILLSAGMAPETSPSRETDARIPRFPLAVDPRAVEVVGQALAGELAPLNPDVVVIWEDPDLIALAHVVARELDVPWVRAWDDGGLVQHGGHLAAGMRVVLVDDAFRDLSVIRALCALASQQHAVVVGAAALIPSFALISSREAVGSIVTCLGPG